MALLVSACAAGGPASTDDTSSPSPSVGEVGPACEQFIACVADATPAATGEAVRDYGVGSDCWLDEDTASVCERACAAARRELVLLAPESEGCQDPSDDSRVFVGDPTSTWDMEEPDPDCPTPVRTILKGSDTWGVEATLEFDDGIEPWVANVLLEASARRMEGDWLEVSFGRGFASMTMHQQVQLGRDVVTCTVTGVRR